MLENNNTVAQKASTGLSYELKVKVLNFFKKANVYIIVNICAWIEFTVFKNYTQTDKKASWNILN